MVFVFVVMAPITQNMNLNIKFMIPLASESTAANVILALQVIVVPNKSLIIFYRSTSWFKFNRQLLRSTILQCGCWILPTFLKYSPVALPSTKVIVNVLVVVVVVVELSGMLLTLRCDREQNTCTKNTFTSNLIS